jgi:endonuclease/exonuclease/phosphatase family metal-dependent hydrolase
MRLEHLISGTAFLTVALLAACVSAGRAPEEPMRVLVYNIHAGKDAGKVENLERVAGIVKDSRAEIVLLQEVDSVTRRSGGIDQIAKLQELTGYSGVFGRTIDWDGGKYGIAILSRWPVIGSRFTPLHVEISDEKARGSYEARGALVAKIAVPGGVIRVVNTHLDATGTDTYRIQQARTLLRVANAQKDSGFTILGGDLNSEPNSAVAKMLEESGLKDLFATCGTGAPFSFPADKPTKRIDYLFAANADACGKGSVLDTQASDHRPVLFELMTRHE